MPVGYQQSLRAFLCRYLYSTNGKHNYCCTTSLYTVDPVYTLVQIPAEFSRPSKPLLQKGILGEMRLWVAIFSSRKLQRDVYDHVRGEHPPTAELRFLDIATYVYRI